MYRGFAILGLPSSVGMPDWQLRVLFGSSPASLVVMLDCGLFTVDKEFLCCDTLR